MKSFGIKRDEKDPRWAKFIEWLNNLFKYGHHKGFDNSFYGIDKNGAIKCSNFQENFIRIITLDEWEAEFMQPKLAGREYDERLLMEFASVKYMPITEFIKRRYAKQDRITEIKEQIEKLSEELKELEK